MLGTAVTLLWYYTLRFRKKQYQILYADPPWDYKGQLQHTGAEGKDSGGAIRHYPTISVREMVKWNIAAISTQNSPFVYVEFFSSP